MNPLYDIDIFISICDFLSTIKEIIRLELLSKYHQYIIRNSNWIKEVKNDNILEYVLKNYKFKWLNISANCDVNRFIKELKNCHTLNLYGTKISDECINYLRSYGCIIDK